MMEWWNDGFNRGNRMAKIILFSDSSRNFDIVYFILRCIIGISKMYSQAEIAILSQQFLEF